MFGHTFHLHRVLRAPAERIYLALQLPQHGYFDGPSLPGETW
jgi:hypothetical protein